MKSRVCDATIELRYTERLLWQGSVYFVTLAAGGEDSAVAVLWLFGMISICTASLPKPGVTFVSITTS
jgi:hypothetical protein